MKDEIEEVPEEIEEIYSLWDYLRFMDHSQAHHVKEVLGFTDERNTVLCTINIQQVIGSSKEYVGTLLIPRINIDRFMDYLNQCQDTNEIELNEITMILNRRRSVSLEYYKEGVGWINLSLKKEKPLFSLYSLYFSP